MGFMGNPGRTKRKKREAIVRKRKDERVPALQNDDVTGMTEDKQEKVIRQSGRAARKDAAEEFYEELGGQARKTPAPQAKPE